MYEKLLGKTIEAVQPLKGKLVLRTKDGSIFIISAGSDGTYGLFIELEVIEGSGWTELKSRG